MCLSKRIVQLTDLMVERGIDVVIISPSGNMTFFIGFNPGRCERFQAVAITRDGRLFCITNRIYQEDMIKALPADSSVYPWDDAGDFHGAVKKAFNDHGLENGVVGVCGAMRAVDFMDLQNLFPGCRFVNAADILSGCRIIKTSRQIDYMRQAGKEADDVMMSLRSFICPGITEKEIKNYIVDSFSQKGRRLSFTPIVASGGNSSKPHYNGDDRVIEDNDVIILDFGCVVNGFCSDISRTYFVGKIDERLKKIYDVVKNAHQSAAESIRLGVTAGEIDRVARQIIEKAGYGEYFLNRTGHGIGIDVHEEPFIRGGSKRVLRPGMALSIEPGIYIPGYVGMRIEDIYIVNENGDGESLNHADRELTVL